MEEEIWCLDIETAPDEKTDLPYALEPYRVGKDSSKASHITSIAVYGPDRVKQIWLDDDTEKFELEIIDLLDSLSGCIVYCHNALFDVSYMLSTVGMESARNIKWRDTMLLNKYLINGQKADEKRISYSLKKCVARAVKDHPDLEEFLELKSRDVKPGEEHDYWLLRGRMDAEFTYLLAKKLLSHMTPEMYPGYVMACSAILPLAEGWVHGIPIDSSALDKYEKNALIKQKDILDKLGFDGSIITSNKQLGNLLFNVWKYEPIGLTPKGAPSVSAENLLRLHQKHSTDERLQLIMDYKKLATTLSKYVGGFRRAREYIGEWSIHGSPKILATITGRMTYQSKLFKKHQTSIALHQLPRKDKGIKRCMVAPPGYKVFYFDFAAQEGRVIADVAPEPIMIKAYNQGIDLHSDLTEEIFGTPYEDIVEANISGEPKELVEQRQAGKLTGLSSFYRIGAKSLAAKFFSTYEYDISIQTAFSYLNSFKKKYPGIPRYWSQAIGIAKQQGYAEAYGGWRYRIYNFDWKGESNAINHRVQGGGSILTYTAIGLVNKRWPDLILVSQVHDSLAYFIPEDIAWETGTAIVKMLNDFNYGALLGFDQKVKFIVDGAIGDNFADLEAIEV